MSSRKRKKLSDDVSPLPSQGSSQDGHDPEVPIYSAAAASPAPQKLSANAPPYPATQDGIPTEELTQSAASPPPALCGRAPSPEPHTFLEQRPASPNLAAFVIEKPSSPPPPSSIATELYPPIEVPVLATTLQQPDDQWVPPIPDLDRPPSPDVDRSYFLSELVSSQDLPDNPDNFEDEDFLNNIFLDDSETCSSQQEKIISDKDRPLYSGASITLHESLVSILSLALAFSLSGQCIEAILQVIALHCLKDGNVFQKSLYMFKKYFSYIRGSVDYEYYCSECFMKIEKTGCVACKSNEESAVCCLIKLPLEHQLQTLFLRKGFASKLMNIQSRPQPAGLCDVYDGSLYKEHVEKKLLGGLFQLSFMWYTDGASLFKSSKMSVWPLFLTINELPYKDRFSRENILVPALWCGPVKPHGNILTRAAYPDLVALHKGVVLKTDGEEEIKVTGSLLCGTGDTPARACMLNMVQHNGEHSCQCCVQKGESREGYPGVRLFPYRPEEIIPRNVSSMVRQGNLANNMTTAYFGLKGSSLLSKLTTDFVKGTAIDAMHNIYGGVAKASTKYFLDKNFKDLKCNIPAGLKSVVDKRLLNVKPPHFLTRVPKSVDDLANWKTSMYKSWFLYFSIPVLKGILNEKYLLHYSTLVAAIMFLNSDSVSTQDLEAADLLIKKYVSYFEDMFDRTLMSLNLHLLLHLVEMVKALGPLWVTSCFPQESLNGVILHLVHGTRYAAMQIAASLQMCLGLPDIVTKLPDGDAKSVCQDLAKTTHPCKSTVVGNCTIIGYWEVLRVIPDYVLELLKNGKLENSNFFSFHSLRKDKVLYVVETKNPRARRDSSSVRFESDGETHVGLLDSLLRVTSCSCSTNKCVCSCLLFAVIRKLDVVGELSTLIPNIKVPNIKKYSVTPNFVLIPVQNLISVCVKIPIGEDLYIALRSNHKETE